MNAIAMRALIRNDLRLYLTDRRAMIIGVVVPILIAAFFGYVFGGNGGRDTPGKIAVAVVDEDRSAVSRAIVADLAGESVIAVQTLDRTRALESVRSGKIQAAAVIPEHFSAAALQALHGTQSKPRVELLIDPSQSVGGRILEGLIAQHGMQEITKEAFSGGLSAPFDVATVTITAARSIPYNGYAHSFAGMTTQFILFAGIDAGVLLLLTRERGIWQRLRCAPITRTEFLLARTAGTFLISLCQFTLIYAVAIGVFSVRIDGSLAGFAAVAAALCLLNAAFGLCLASIGRTAPATRGIAAMVTLLLVMVGGAWVPSFLFPQWLQQVSLAAPTRWAVDGLDAMTWRGLGLAAAAAPVAVLCASALLCLAVAIWRFRWEE